MHNTIVYGHKNDNFVSVHSLFMPEFPSHLDMTKKGWDSLLILYVQHILSNIFMNGLRLRLAYTTCDFVQQFLSLFMRLTNYIVSSQFNKG